MKSPMHSRTSIRKRLIARTFKDTANVYQPIKSLGLVNEPIVTFPDSASFSVKGSLQMVTGREFIFQQKPTLQADYIFLCAVTALRIQEEDKLYIQSRWFEVMFNDDLTFKGICQELYLREML